MPALIRPAQSLASQGQRPGVSSSPFARGSFLSHCITPVLSGRASEALAFLPHKPCRSPMLESKGRGAPPLQVFHRQQRPNARQPSWRSGHAGDCLPAAQGLGPACTVAAHLGPDGKERAPLPSGRASPGRRTAPYLRRLYRASSPQTVPTGDAPLRVSCWSGIRSAIEMGPVLRQGRGRHDPCSTCLPKGQLRG